MGAAKFLRVIDFSLLYHRSSEDYCKVDVSDTAMLGNKNALDAGLAKKQYFVF